MSISSQKSSADDATAREPKQERGRARVARLLAAAAEVFAEKGFDGATMTEIAVKAGASIGSLYQFFPTKEHVGHAVQRQGSEELSAMLDALLPRCAGQDAATVAALLHEELVAVLARNRAFIVLADGRAEAPYKPEMRLRMRAQIAALFAGASPALPPAEAEITAVLVLQLMRSAVVLMQEPDPALREKALQAQREMLQAYLLRDGPPRAAP